MKIKVSIDALGWYLANLVWSYNEKNGVPPTDPIEYLPNVPNLIAHLRPWGDAPFIRAALVDLVRKKKLNAQLTDRLCGWADMDLEMDELRPILEFMLVQIERNLQPPINDDADVEFISTGPDETVWRAQRDALNPGLTWRLPSDPDGTPQRVEAKQPCPRSGFWFTPAQAGSRRYFKSGDLMPEVGGDYGATIWQWDQNQEPPKL